MAGIAMSLCLRAVLLVALLGWGAAARAQQTFDGQGNTNVKVVPSNQTPQWGPLQVGSPAGKPLIDNQSSQYPAGAIPITASTVGTTGVTTATLAGTNGLRTWICGFSITSSATAAAAGNATITGTIGGTMNFQQFTQAVASGVGINGTTFAPCIPSTGQNTAIAVVSAAPGTAGNISVTAWGFNQ